MAAVVPNLRLLAHCVQAEGSEPRRGQRAQSQRCGGLTNCRDVAPRACSYGLGRISKPTPRGSRCASGWSREKKRHPGSVRSFARNCEPLLAASDLYSAETATHMQPENQSEVDAELTSTTQDELDDIGLGKLFDESLSFSALDFIHGLLEDAVEEHAEDAVQQLGFTSEALLIQPEREPPIFEADQEDDVDESDADDAASVISCAGSQLQSSFVTEKIAFETAARELAEDIVRTVAQDMTQKLTLDRALPTKTSKMLDYDRSKFEAAVREDAPMESSPFSTSVAQTVPASAEFAGSDHNTAAPLVLSWEADEKLTFAAANAFVALRALAEAEASVTIQCRWRQRQATRLKTRLSVTQSEELVGGSALSTSFVHTSPRPPTSPSNSSAPRRRVGAIPKSAVALPSGASLSEDGTIRPPPTPPMPAGPRPSRPGGRPSFRCRQQAEVSATCATPRRADCFVPTPSEPNTPNLSTPLVPSAPTSSADGKQFRRKAGPSALEIDMGLAAEPSALSGDTRSKSVGIRLASVETEPLWCPTKRIVGTGLLPVLSSKSQLKEDLCSWSIGVSTESRAVRSLTPRSKTSLSEAATKIVMRSSNEGRFVL